MTHAPRQRPRRCRACGLLAAVWAAAACASPSPAIPKAADDDPAARSTPTGARYGAGAPRLEGYLDSAEMIDRLDRLATESPLASRSSIGQSIEGREIPLLTLSARNGAREPAVLIVAGLDGTHLVGSEIAVRLAERLVREHPELLESMTIHLIPRANPDGAERNLRGVRAGHAANLRPVDLDRDGAIGEDGPLDLDGDGAIVLMRQADPPLGIAATHLADPAEPRLLKTPDRAKGERATYAVWTEGLDQDGDGQIAEDGPGGVRLDRNFPHLHPEHEPDAGRHSLSEPETRAIAEFVVANPNIVLAVVYGRHDTMSRPPEFKRMDATGRTPLGLLEEDRTLHESLSLLFKETVDETRAPEADHAGSLHAWLYAHRGIATIASVGWGRPDPPAPSAAETADAEQLPSAEAPAVGEAAERSEEERSAEERPAAEPAAIEPRKARDRSLKPGDPEAAAWLAVSDAMGGVGFVEWHPYEHPTLGPVEIGGFVPGFTANPPPQQLDAIAEGHLSLLAELVRRRPQLRIEGPQVKELAPGLYEVRLAIVNEGRLPTSTEMGARARATLPIVLRLSTPTERIVAGRRIERAWRIEGDGGRFERHWILREPPGGEIEIEMVSDHFPDLLLRFAASPDAALSTEPLPKERR